MKSENTSQDKFILLFDSTMDFTAVYPIIKEKNPKIITFDYDSHVIFKEKNIPHEISDIFVSKSELDSIQKKSYSFGNWFLDPVISDFINYDGINLGELFYYEFYPELLPVIKKFYEITKIFELFQNSTFFSSSILFEIISCFSSTTVKIENNFSKPKIHENEIKIPLKIGNFSHSFKIKYGTIQKISKIFDNFYTLFLSKNKKLKNGNNVLLVDFTTKKYSYIFEYVKKFSLNIIKFDRILPAIWDLNSFSILKKSDCILENYSNLVDKDLLHSVNSGKNSLKTKTNLLWKKSNYFESFFSINEKSFWVILKPIFKKIYEKKSLEAIQEIELTKKLFKKYHFDSILVWTEHHMNHLIAINLAKKQNIPICFIQHGFAVDSKENIDIMKFSRTIPIYSNNILVWGNVFKKYLSSFGFKEDTIKTIGAPYLDKTFLQKNKKSLKKKFILLAATSPTSDSLVDMRVETMTKYLESIKKICETTKKLDQNLIIKLHPQPREYDITDFVKKIDPRILVLKSGDISPLIASCDIFAVTDISTTILEAQILQKPVISFNVRELGISEILKSDSCISSSIDNFEYHLTRLLTDQKFKQDVIERGTKFSKNYVSNLGRSSESLLSFLENIN